jgi:hypothetical protein
MIAVATLAHCLFVYRGGTQLFRDSDSGWHIRNGEWILDHKALPRTDPYSFSRAGEPWLAWEWGADVLMGLAHRIDGLRGVTILFALAISMCAWMWCRLNFAAGGDFFLTALLAPPMVTTASLHWLARPHVLSWVFLLGALWYAERTQFRKLDLLAIAAVTAVWANLHGSFFLAPLIALIYAVSHFVRPLVWPFSLKAERERGLWFLYAAMAALGGSLLNPYGWRLHAHVFSYLRTDELTSRIAEFQSFNFHDQQATQVALAMFLAAAGAILALTQKKLAHFLLAAILLWAALRSARVIPLVALLILPLANGAFTEALRGARDLRPRIDRALNAALGYSARLRMIDQRLSGAAFSVLAVLIILISLRAPAMSEDIGFPARQFPVKAAAALDQLPADARILSPDSYGGYLIYRFNGARKIFFDGRSDFYGAGFMQEYLVLINAKPGWQAIVRRYGFTHALLPDDSTLTAALEQAGWTIRYKDDVATLLEAH